VQAPAAPIGDLAQNYYPFLDITRGNCTVKATLGPTHWSDDLQVRHGVLELVGTFQFSKSLHQSPSSSSAHVQALGLDGEQSPSFCETFAGHLYQPNCATHIKLSQILFSQSYIAEGYHESYGHVTTAFSWVIAM